jgi:16S rRNA (guanine(1405)-N(7))-methyltransferase
MTPDGAAQSASKGHVASTGEWIADERFAPLWDGLLASVVKQYRIDENAARTLLRQALETSRLSSVVADATSPAEIRRTRAFKDAAAAAKRQVYHALRRYRADDGQYAAALTRLQQGGASLAHGELTTIIAQITNGHASTRERMADEQAFNGFLAQAIGPAATLLDVGCGVQPLRFPFDALPGLSMYAAVDSNRRSIDAVAAFAAAAGNGVLRPQCNDLSGGWPSVLAAFEIAEDGCFDVALMLKLVPVVARQAKDVLAVLTKTPARRWIVTGSSVSLAKRASIARRERQVLLRFIADSGRNIVSEFSFGEEFGFVVQGRPTPHDKLK